MTCPSLTWPEYTIHLRQSEVMLLCRVNQTIMTQHLVFLTHSHIGSFIGLWDYLQRLFNSMCTWTVKPAVGVFIYLQFTTKFQVGKMLNLKGNSLYVRSPGRCMNWHTVRRVHTVETYSLTLENINAHVFFK